MRRADIPTFYLYGEPRRTVDERFVHVEALIERTRPSEWTIRPHAHPELNHVFHVTSGSGVMHADTVHLKFSAPCLLLVPAGTVHAFEWDLASSGTVITLASSYLSDFVRRDPDLDKIFCQAAVIQFAADGRVGGAIAVLAQELNWAAPGHKAAADAYLLHLLVTILRLRPPQGAGAGEPGPEGVLVARLRERIEERFRLREPVDAYASALGASARRLRAACAAVAHQSPADMIDQRTILEAKRSLIYGNLPIAQVAYTLGFADPAYFSRFFRKHAGVSPADYRRRISRTNSPD